MCINSRCIWYSVHKSAWHICFPFQLPEFWNQSKYHMVLSSEHYKSQSAKWDQT